MKKKSNRGGRSVYLFIYFDIKKSFAFFQPKKKWFPARYFSKKRKLAASGNSPHSWLTPLSYIHIHLGFVLKSRVYSRSVYTLSTLTPIGIRRADKSNSRY